MAEEISILQEIDESLRIERLERFWQRFGNWVIAGCAGIVLATTASVAWKNHLRDAHARTTDILLNAERLAADGKYDEADHLLAGVSGAGSLPALAKLERAHALISAGKAKEALAAYQELAKENSADVTLRDFAALQAAILGINQSTGAPELGLASTPGAPYAISAEETQSAYLLKEGKPKPAAELLSSIAGDTAAPSSSRSRAMELLATVSKDTP